MAGMKDQIEGKAKEIKGKLTDDEATEAEGKAQHTKGRVENKVEGKLDEIKGKLKQAAS
jgi:uncharacterized protein YjbJ (UPF0337 family)